MLTQLSPYNVTQKLMINVMNKLDHKFINQNKTHAIGTLNFSSWNTTLVMHTHLGRLHSTWLMKFNKLTIYRLYWSQKVWFFYIFCYQLILYLLMCFLLNHKTYGG